MAVKKTAEKRRQFVGETHRCPKPLAFFPTRRFMRWSTSNRTPRTGYLSVSQLKEPYKQNSELSPRRHYQEEF